MTDEDTRTLLRLADKTNDPDAWLRVGRAFARIRSFDESGHAFARAASLGADVDADLDTVAPPTDELRVIASTPLTRENLVFSLAWTPDARALLVGCARSVESWTPSMDARTPLDQNGAAQLAVSANGARAVFARGLFHERSDGGDLVVRELATGAERIVGRGHSRIDSVQIFGASDELVACTYADRVRVYRLGTTPEDDELVVHLTGAQTSIERAGNVVVVRGLDDFRTLSLIDPLARRPRHVIELEKEGEERRAIAVGRRALVVTRKPLTATLVSEDRLLHRVTTDESHDARWLFPIGASPSGSLVALVEADARLLLLDVARGSTRHFEKAELPTGQDAIRVLAWSPSGRKLAVATTGALFVLAPDAAD